MQAIPKPQALDADAMLFQVPQGDEERFAETLRGTCAYAEQLWRQLQAVREYLLRSTQEGRARPAGPQDEPGWREWRDIYAAVTGVLAGPRHDAGFAASEAELESRYRRRDDQPGDAATRGGAEPG